MLIYFFPPPLPTIVRKNGAAGTLHEAWIRRAWCGNWRRRLVFLGMMALWPAYVVISASFDTALLGGRARRETGKSRCRQFLEQLWVAFANGLAPRHYYMFELYRTDMVARASEFLNRTETKAFLYGPFVDQSKWINDRFPFANKKQFHDLCIRHGLPTVPILALGHKGKVRAGCAAAWARRSGATATAATIAMVARRVRSSVSKCGCDGWWSDRNGTASASSSG